MRDVVVGRIQGDLEGLGIRNGGRIKGKFGGRM